MFAKLFGSGVKGDGAVAVSPQETLEQLAKTKSHMETRHAQIGSQASLHRSHALQHRKTGRKREALQSLKAAKMLESQMVILETFAQNTGSQMLQVETAQFTQLAIDGNRSAARVMNNMLPQLHADDVEETMGDIEEATENLTEIQDIFARNLVSVAGDFSEDDLWDELEKMENQQEAPKAETGPLHETQEMLDALPTHVFAPITPEPEPEPAPSEAQMVAEELNF